MIPGIDLASYQGQPAAWSKIAGDYDWAAVKMTELSSAGPYVNPAAGADWAYLKANGKGRIAYLFGHPGMAASNTVTLFASVVNRLGLDDGDGICLDLEVTDGLVPGQVAAWGRDVLGQMRAGWHRPPVLYTYLDFAAAGNCDGMGGYPLWIADPSSPAGHPRVPAPWHGWDLHQYATVPLDRDVARYPDLAAMKAALGKTPPPRPPSPRLTLEDPMLLAGKDVALPVAIPAGTGGLRFAASAAANVQVQFHTEKSHRNLVLTWVAGSHAEAVPKGCHAAVITRTDTGTGMVSMAFDPSGA